MSFLNKIIKPIAVIGGSAILGSMLFPETTSMLTGGLLGSEGSSSTVGNLFDNSTAAGSSSLWNNPTVISSGILAGTSLLSGLFGSNAQDDLNKASLEEKKREFDLQMEQNKAELAQALQIAKIHAGAAGAGAGASAAAQKAIAKAQIIMQAAGLKGQALQIPLEAEKHQADVAQNTGAQSGAFFNSLIPSLEAPALRSGH